MTSSKLRRWARKLLPPVLFLLLLWLFFRFLVPWFLPLILSFLVAYWLRPVTRFLRERLRFPRFLAAGTAVGGAWLTLAGAVALLAMRLGKEGAVLFSRLPEMLDNLPEALESLRGLAEKLIIAAPLQLQEFLEGSLENLLTRGISIPTKLYEFLSSFLSDTLLGLPAVALFFAIFLLSNYFFTRDYDEIGVFLHAHLPQPLQTWVFQFKNKVMDTFGQWLKAQGLLILITFGILLLGFLILHMDAALFLAMVIALLDALPVIGVGTALLPWSLFAMFSGNFFYGLFLLALWGITWLMRTVLEPKLLSVRLGLHPLAALSSVYLGFQLMGVWGMVVAPLCAVILVQVYQWDFFSFSGGEAATKGRGTRSDGAGSPSP